MHFTHAGRNLLAWRGPYTPRRPYFNYRTYPYKRIDYSKCTLSTCFDALTELGAFMRTEILCISVLRVASGPRVKLASC